MSWPPPSGGRSSHGQESRYNIYRMLLLHYGYDPFSNHEHFPILVHLALDPPLIGLPVLSSVDPSVKALDHVGAVGTYAAPLGLHDMVIMYSQLALEVPVCREGNFVRDAWKFYQSFRLEIICHLVGSLTSLRRLGQAEHVVLRELPPPSSTGGGTRRSENTSGWPMVDEVKRLGLMANICCQCGPSRGEEATSYAAAAKRIYETGSFWTPLPAHYRHDAFNFFSKAFQSGAWAAQDLGRMDEAFMWDALAVDVRQKAAEMGVNIPRTFYMETREAMRLMRQEETVARAEEVLRSQVEVRNQLSIMMILGCPMLSYR